MGENIKMYRNKIRLSKPKEVQKLLGRTVNMLIDDEITEGKARSKGYLCQIMLKGFETIDLQDQIIQLQEFKDELKKLHEEAGDRV